ncbi:hypothetical protein LV716_15060 [Flagellimonas sp. HMM57]|uniref:hypothetical protein n=1 Tax=unclassified Flagellimonas TaxID=2644544 RepID=UPI0013D5C3E2|nr:MULTISPECIES: hypothetical protein [unclassified Flagellimonas]MBS9463128.1 hypothetical protein [Flagellimonas sp. 389]UII75565.1 hypothetical protein LV716_15060 [Flagellimonas sp. HMM57]
MENSHTLFYAIGGILNALAQLVVIIGCIVLVTKQKNTGTILMLVASILSLLFLIGNFAGNMIAGHYGTDAILLFSKMTAVLTPLPYVLFAAGLLTYGVMYVNKTKPVA